MFVSHTSEIGGPTYRLLKLVKFLRSRHEIFLAAPDQGALFDKLKDLGIQNFITPRKDFDRKTIPWLYAKIKGNSIDLVYGNNYSTSSRNALIGAKMAGRPFIWHINEMLKDDRKKHWKKAFFLRYSDALIADSKACARSVEHHVSNKQVHQIYNGIELNEYDFDITESKSYIREVLNIPSGHRIVINAGIVCPRKGQAIGVRVAEKILSEYPDLTFVFLGTLSEDPDYAQKVLSNVSELDLQDRIMFPGFRDDFPRLLVGSDLFLHTAKKDPHPLVVLSAMSARLPVVAFSVDGVKETVINGKTGHLVPFGDIDGMVMAIMNSLNDQRQMIHMGETGRKRVEKHFTDEQTSLKINNVIEGLLQ